MEKLFAAQDILRREPAGSAKHSRTLEELKRNVPAPVLAHFLRLIAQGQKGIAFVTNGVCSACHLRVASGTVATLRKADDLQLCEHCGCYLQLAPDQPTPAPATVQPKRRRMSASAV